MKRSTLITIAVIVVVLLVIVGLVLFLNRNRNPAAPASTGQGGPPPAGGYATIADIPKVSPIDQTFKGCPASGDGGDPALNTLKNRIDENNWQPTTVASLLALQWPHTIERLPRNRWTRFDTLEIARYEGAPVQVEGYLADAKKQGPESCNCHSVTERDFHIWMVADPSQGRDQSVVIETTPRVMAVHPGWTIKSLGQIENNKQKVRISGWLMMDPEHPDQVGKTRGTIWEIHPIMQIETQQGGQWKALDNGTTGVKSAPVAAAQGTSTSGTPTAIALAITPESTATPPPPGSTNAQYNGAVQITAVNADGVKKGEPDEYVEITNKGTQPVDITDWTLQDPAGKDTYKWDSYTMKPGEVIRVYTNEVHPDTGGFTFGSKSPRWNNNGGTAELYDADHELVSRFPYAKK